MAVYELSQTLVFGLKTRATTGALADLGVMPTATVTKPDGTTVSGSVTKVGGVLGTYYATTAGSMAAAGGASGPGQGPIRADCPIRT